MSEIVQVERSADSRYLAFLKTLEMFLALDMKLVSSMAEMPESS